MSRSLMAKIGYLFARGAFAALKDKMDPRKVNGGVFLGLEGIVIKSHGGTDADRLRQRRPNSATRWRATNLMAKVREMAAAIARSGGAAAAARPCRRVRKIPTCPSCAPSSAAAAPICRQRIVTNAELADARRHHRRMDRPAHRHPPAPRRRRRRDRPPMLGLKAAQAALADAGMDAVRDRPDHRRHRDAGPHLSRDRDADPGGARHHPAAPPSISRRSAPASSSRSPPPTSSSPRARRKRRAGDRRRDLLAHPRLGGPHHLRAVRRRRRRGRAEGRAGRGHAWPTAAC